MTTPNDPYAQQPSGDQPAGYPPPPGAGQYYPPGPPPGYQTGGMPPLPPGVELASRGRRTGAFFLAFPLEIVTLGIGYLIWGLVLWGKGTSPALKVLKCRVVDARTGQPVTFGKMVMRDFVTGLIYAVCVIVEIVSWFMFLTGDLRQSLADKIASTIVVYDPNGVLDGS